MRLLQGPLPRQRRTVSPSEDGTLLVFYLRGRQHRQSGAPILQHLRESSAAFYEVRMLLFLFEAD